MYAPYDSDSYYTHFVCRENEAQSLDMIPLECPTVRIGYAIVRSGSYPSCFSLSLSINVIH